MATNFSRPASLPGSAKGRGRARSDKGIVVALVLDSAKIRKELQRGYFKVLQGEADKAMLYAVALADRELSEEPLRKDRYGNSRRGDKTEGKRRYRDSFHIEAELNSRNRVRITIVQNHPAWRFIEYGTRAHTITAKRAKKLSFPGAGAPDAGHGFAVVGPPWSAPSSVNHPGSKAFRIMGRTATAVRKRQTARTPR